MQSTSLPSGLPSKTDYRCSQATTGYSRACVRHLRDVTGLPIVIADDLIEETANTGGFLAFSGVLRRIAVKISKICNDLRLLSSGPRAGFNEINLPASKSTSNPHHS